MPALGEAPRLIFSLAERAGARQGADIRRALAGERERQLLFIHASLARPRSGLSPFPSDDARRLIKLLTVRQWSLQAGGKGLKPSNAAELA